MAMLTLLLISVLVNMKSKVIKVSRIDILANTQRAEGGAGAVILNLYK